MSFLILAITLMIVATLIFGFLSYGYIRPFTEKASTAIIQSAFIGVAVSSVFLLVLNLITNL